MQKLTNSVDNAKEILKLLTASEMVDKSVNYTKDFAGIVSNRNTRDYEMLMQWSKVFLLNKNFTTFSGDTAAQSLLFPMELVYESYVAQQMKKVMSPAGWQVSSQEKKKYLFDKESGLFISGEEKQINYASQVWLILAGAVDSAEGAEILDRLVELKPEKGMVSPYMNHHFVEALLMCGKRDQAMEYMKYYWGGMISHGADTFWELYNPENPAESPYGSSIVNSYCHAWSCTPTYLLRKYFN